MELKIIRTAAELNALWTIMADAEFIAYDTETTGIGHDDSVIGFSVASDIESGYYVSLLEWSKEEQKLVPTEIARTNASTFIGFLITKKLIMHNSVFDCRMTKRSFGIDLMPSVHTDTMLLGHLLNENRSNGLKELGVSIFGEDSRKEQLEVKESAKANGGVLTREKYELFKADPAILGKYGAKDATLTLKLFYHLVPELYEQELDQFFYEDESMPLLRGSTYELNTVGLSVDAVALQKLKQELETETLEAKAFIYKEITPVVQDKYPATRPANTFNIGSSKQMAWLLFIRLGCEFNVLTEGGRTLCRALGLKLPYNIGAKREFLRIVEENKGRVYSEGGWNPKTRKKEKPKKVGDVWNYLAANKATLKKLADRFKWVSRLLDYSKSLKILNTYVIGIQNRAVYNVIRPSFLQHGTTSGRYASRDPNFQNLPREDKRVKSCIVSRPGKVFVGADYSQLEPRVFASLSNDYRLQRCFEDGDDFYSVIGAEVFGKTEYSLKKDDKTSFAKTFPELRQIAKVIALATTYGTTPAQMAPTIGKTLDECREIIYNYLEKFEKVREFMEESHEMAKKNGRVENLFGRPRRMPDAMNITKIYGHAAHSDLPYEARTPLNLAVNHRVQSTAASIVNRASIAFWKKVRENNIADCRIVLQVHDEIVCECREEDAEKVAALLKDSMENTTTLPGVKLVADPIVGRNLAQLKGE